MPDKLLLLEADQPDGQGQPMQVVVLLVDCRFRPKVQIFCRCCLQGGDGKLRFRLPEEPGTLVSLAVRACKLSLCLRFQTLHLVTSDDLARELADRSPAWRLTVLDWELPRGSVNLLDMRIRGRGDVFEQPVKAASRSRNSKQAGQAQAALDVLDAGGPFEIGQSLADQNTRNRPGSWLRPRRHLPHLAIQRQGPLKGGDSRRQHPHQGTPRGIRRGRGDCSNVIRRSRDGRRPRGHALTDAQGRPLALRLTPGQAHDLVGLGRPTQRVRTQNA